MRTAMIASAGSGIDWQRLRSDICQSTMLVGARREAAVISVLRDLGVQKVRLITSGSRRLVGVEGYGLDVVERVILTDDSGVSELAVLPGGRS